MGLVEGETLSGLDLGEQNGRAGKGTSEGSEAEAEGRGEKGRKNRVPSHRGRNEIGAVRQYLSERRPAKQARDRHLIEMKRYVVAGCHDRIEGLEVGISG